MGANVFRMNAFRMNDRQMNGNECPSIQYPPEHKCVGQEKAACHRSHLNAQKKAELRIKKSPESSELNEDTRIWRRIESQDSYGIRLISDSGKFALISNVYLLISFSKPSSRFYHLFACDHKLCFSNGLQFFLLSNCLVCAINSKD